MCDWNEKDRRMEDKIRSGKKRNMGGERGEDKKEEYSIIIVIRIYYIHHTSNAQPDTDTPTQILSPNRIQIRTTHLNHPLR
jgi:hypothetical protein